MLLQLVGQPLALADVVLDGDVVRDAAIGLTDRGDAGELVIDLAVLAAIDELALPDFPGGEGGPELGVGRSLRLAGLQQAWVVSDHFLAAVAGGVDEGLIDVLDSGFHVSDDDAAGALLDRAGELAQLLVGAHPLGHVLHRAGRTQRLAEFVVVGLAAFMHVLDAAVGHAQAMHDVVGRVGGDRFPIGRIDAGTVVGMDHRQEGFVSDLEAALFQFKDGVDLVRPPELPADHVQLPAAEQGDMLRFAQTLLTASQGQFSGPLILQHAQQGSPGLICRVEQPGQFGLRALVLPFSADALRFVALQRIDHEVEVLAQCADFVLMTGFQPEPTLAASHPPQAFEQSGQAACGAPPDPKGKEPAYCNGQQGKQRSMQFDPMQRGLQAAAMQTNPGPAQQALTGPDRCGHVNQAFFAGEHTHFVSIALVQGQTDRVAQILPHALRVAMGQDQVFRGQQHHVAYIGLSRHGADHLLGADHVVRHHPGRTADSQGTGQTAGLLLTFGAQELALFGDDIQHQEAHEQGVDQRDIERELGANREIAVATQPGFQPCGKAGHGARP